jgi:hypothetical protein
MVEPACTKSLYINHALSNFYGTGIEIWAGWADYEQLLKIENIVVSTV